MSITDLEQPCPMCGESMLISAGECPACGESLKHHFQLNEEEIRAELIEKFRREMLALTGFFLIVGAIACGIGVFFLKESLWVRQAFEADELFYPAVFGLITLCGVGWIVCGIASAQKIMTGVQAGLVISFVMVVLNLCCWNVCGVILLIPVIVQCYRVKKISRQMEAAGVPLSYKL